MLKEREEDLFGTQMDKDRIINLMVETQAFKEDDSPIFPLASGRFSRHYVDCKVALSLPAFRREIGTAIFEMVRDSNIQAVGGLELGAYPIAIAVSDVAYEHGQQLNAFVVRKKPKKHGLKNHVEGHVTEGSRVLIVDDVITTGNSTIQAIEKSENDGLSVTRVIALIDREEAGGRSNIEQKGFRFDSLLTLKDLQRNKDRSEIKECDD